MRSIVFSSAHFGTYVNFGLHWETSFSNILSHYQSSDEPIYFQWWFLYLHLLFFHLLIRDRFKRILICRFQPSRNAITSVLYFLTRKNVLRIGWENMITNCVLLSLICFDNVLCTHFWKPWKKSQHKNCTQMNLKLIFILTFCCRLVYHWSFPQTNLCYSERVLWAHLFTLVLWKMAVKWL